MHCLTYGGVGFAVRQELIIKRSPKTLFRKNFVFRVPNVQCLWGNDFNDWRHSLITFAFRVGGGSIKMQTYENGRKRRCLINQHVIFLIEYLVLKLLTIVSRFFVSLFKAPVLLKIFVLKNYFSFVSKIKNQLLLLQTIHLN